MKTVDGRVTEAGGTVLDVCRSAGADVPTLCHDHRTRPGGHCRACMVEVDGRHLPACSTPARDGCSIRTQTPALAAYRLDLAELVLSESHPRGPAAAWCTASGASGERYMRTSSAVPRVDDSHPYLRLDLAACIKCRLCLSVCDEVQGQFVYAFGGRGADTHLTWGMGTFADTDCVACGACASVCPSEAISDVDRQRAEHEPPVRVVRTTCGYCGVGCQLDVHATADDVVRVEGTRGAAVNDGHLCVKGRYAHGFVRHRDRLTTPLIRRDGRLEPASLAEALSLVATTFEAHRGKVAALSSSRCTNEENYLLQKWMRAGFGTNNVDCCARVCHGPTAAGMRRVFGTGAATNSIADSHELRFEPSEPVTFSSLKQIRSKSTVTGFPKSPICVNCPCFRIALNPASTARGEPAHSSTTSTPMFAVKSLTSSPRLWLVTSMTRSAPRVLATCRRSLSISVPATMTRAPCERATWSESRPIAPGPVISTQSSA